MDNGLVLHKVVNCSHYRGRTEVEWLPATTEALDADAWLSWLLQCDSWKIAAICRLYRRFSVCAISGHALWLVPLLNWLCSAISGVTMVGWVGDAGLWERERETRFFYWGKKGWQQWEKLESGYNFLGQKECLGMQPNWATLHPK